MAIHIVTVPPTAMQGSYKTKVRDDLGETPAQAALWHYNNARAREGLPPVSRMPRGTTYARQKGE